MTSKINSQDIDSQPCDTNAVSRLEASEPESKIMVLKEYCLRHTHSQDCTRCELACPHDAISFDDETRSPYIHAEVCSRCGICFGICDAFSSTKVTMQDLHSRLARIALQGDDVYLTCPENIFPGLKPAHNVVTLPCLASLSPEFWTLVLAENIPVKIACDPAYCTDCERAGEIAETLYEHAISQAEDWTDTRVGYSDVIPEKEDLLKDLSNPDGVDRRSAFDNLIGDVGDIASGKRRLRNSEVLQQFYERKERSKALNRLNLGDSESFNSFVPLGRTKKILFPKQQFLLEALARNSAIAERILVDISQTDCELCTNELSCSQTCPTGARYPNPETGELEMDVSYCIGCGICVEACPHHAISMVETNARIFGVSDSDGE